MEKGDFAQGKVDCNGNPARKDKHGGMKSALLVLALFGFQNLADLALAVNLVTYFSTIMHFSLADAANELTNYLGTTYIISIVMAVLADTYIGRFTTLIISAGIEFVGLAIMGVQAHYPKLKPAPCNIFDPTATCHEVSGANSALLFLSIYLVGIGSAGIKAALPSHGADQFDEKDPREVKGLSSFFNWILLSSCIGGFGSLTILVWIQDNKGWDWGFLLSSIAMFLGIVFCVCGVPWYRFHVIQKNNPLVEIIQVYIAAIRNRKLSLPEDPEELYEIEMDKEAATETEYLPHRDVYRFLDKAAIQTNKSTTKVNPWKLCRVTQVENAKFLLAMLPIFFCAIIMTLCLAQLQTFSVQQGITMDTRLGKSFHMPPASLPIIPVFFLIILIPFYDRMVVPLLRRLTGIPTGITYLQRVGVGLILSSASMAVAALMESKRKQVAASHNMLDAIPVLQPLPISVFWLSFQYFVFGIADMFTLVGLLEFFYSQAPKGLKSISSCFLWCSMSLGYFLSSIMVQAVNSATKASTSTGGWLGGNNINRNYLNLFYWLLSILSLINFFVYLFVAKRYNYRPENTTKVYDENSKELKSTKFDHPSKSFSA